MTGARDVELSRHSFYVQVAGRLNRVYLGFDSGDVSTSIWITVAELESIRNAINEVLKESKQGK